MAIEVDHATVHWWVRRFTALLADAARFGRDRVGDRWQVDETYVKVAGRWVYLHRAVDQSGACTSRRAREPARRFFQCARRAIGVVPVDVVTDRAPTYPRVLVARWPAAWHHTEQYANNRVEADHAQLKQRLRRIETMTGLRILPPVTPSCRTFVVAATRIPRPTAQRGVTFRRISSDAIRTVTEVVVDPADSRRMYVGTYTGTYVSGVYRSIDRGATWALFGNGMTTTWTHALTITSTSSALYAGTTGLGVSGSGGGVFTYRLK